MSPRMEGHRPVQAPHSAPVTQRLLPHVKPGDGRSDDEALDLRRALEDREDLRVPVPSLDREVPGVPVAAEDLDGLFGARTAVSPATSLDIEPSARSNLRPCRAIQAARQVSSRAAATAVCMSASMNATAWFWPTGLPNCTRCRA